MIPPTTHVTIPKIIAAFMDRAAIGNRVDMLPESYRRYLVNGLRKELGFGAVPIRLDARARRNPFAP